MLETKRSQQVMEQGQVKWFGYITRMKGSTRNTQREADRTSVENESRGGWELV